MATTPDQRAAEEGPGGLDKRLADEARFIKSWIDNPLQAGALSPSSRFLSKMMAHAVDPATPGPIVELGPGTGPVTQALIERGVAPGRLVLVEYDEGFCRLLAQRFPEARVVRGDAYNLPATLRGALDAPPSAVVSSLPLLNRPEALRLRLLADALELMEADGVFVQFTYGMVSPIPRGRRGLRYRWFQSEASPPILRNLPPARVWVYRRPAAEGRVFAEELVLIDRLKETTGKVKEEWRERAEKAQAELAELKEKTLRLQEEWRGKSDRAEARLKEGADRLQAELKESVERLQGELKEGVERLQGELKEVTGKTRKGLFAGARKLLVEIEEGTRKLRDRLEDKAREREEKLREREAKERAARRNADP